MNVYVPTPVYRCPAANALRMEGLKPYEIVVGADTDYGALFARLWERGPFVLVEHDIIPWPGAVQALIDCPEPLCRYRYPLHEGNVTLGFGIGKYVPEGPAPKEWAKTEWRMLDGFVVPALNERLGQPHVHEPPVAHARAVLAP